MQAGEGFLRGLDRCSAPVKRAVDQKDYGFGIGFGFLLVSVSCQFGAQLAEVFDDAVMDDRDSTRAMRMGVADGCRAMGGPAGVADPGLSGERFVDQKVGEIDELADRAES
jgi:hypothetical protein